MLSWAEVSKWDPLTWDDIAADLRKACKAADGQREDVRAALAGIELQGQTANAARQALSEVIAELDLQMVNVQRTASATQEFANQVWDVKHLVGQAETESSGYRQLWIAATGKVGCDEADLC